MNPEWAEEYLELLIRGMRGEYGAHGMFFSFELCGMPLEEERVGE